MFYGNGVAKTMGAKAKKQIKVDYDSLTDELKAMYDDYRLKFNGENIYTLRDEAKKLLIPSATTFAKNDLITLMVDKIITNYMSFDPKENQHKEIHLKLMEDFINSEYIEGERLEGYIRLNATDGELVICNKISSDIFFPQGLINEFSLSEGDFVTVKAEDIGHGSRGVFDVLEVKGRKNPRGKMPAFDSVLPLKKKEKLWALDNEVAKGGRVIADLTDTETVAAAVNGAEKQGCKTAVALLDELPENLADVTSLISGPYMYALCDTDVETQKKTALLTLNIAKRYAECGEDVVLIIRNLDILDIDSARRIFGSARCFERGSLTVIAQSDNASLRRLATDVI